MSATTAAGSRRVLGFWECLGWVGISTIVEVAAVLGTRNSTVVFPIEVAFLIGMALLYQLPAVGPIRRWWLVPSFILGMVFCLITALGILHTFGFKSTSHEALPQIPQLKTIVCTVIIAPLFEEFFFRGWMWEALRRRRSWPVTLLITSALFVALHLPTYLMTATSFSITALALGIIRHYGGTIRASFYVHAFNNLVVAVVGAQTLHGFSTGTPILAEDRAKIVPMSRYLYPPPDPPYDFGKTSRFTYPSTVNQPSGGFFGYPS